MSEALRIEPQIHIDQLERMADFSRWGAAVAEVLGFGQAAFLAAYHENQLRLTREAVEGHLVGAAVMALAAETDPWQGTMTELLRVLTGAGERAGLFRLSTSGKPDVRGWPGGPHILARRLTEVRSNLLDLGVEVTVGRGDARWVQIMRLDPEGPENSDGSDEFLEGDESSPDATSSGVQAALLEEVF